MATVCPLTECDLFATGKTMRWNRCTIARAPKSRILRGRIAPPSSSLSGGADPPPTHTNKKVALRRSTHGRRISFRPPSERVPNRLSPQCLSPLRLWTGLKFSTLHAHPVPGLGWGFSTRSPTCEVVTNPLKETWPARWDDHGKNSSIATPWIGICFVASS